MRLHALATGRLRLAGGPWRPSWSFAIEHEAGLVVVDAGLRPGARPPLRRRLRGDVWLADERDGLAARLREAGLDPSAATALVLTDPRRPELTGGADDLLQARRVTATGELVAGVHVLPGPAPGTLVVLAEHRRRRFLLPGAAVLDEDALLAEPAPARLRQLAGEAPTIVLPAHDPLGAMRLARGRITATSPSRASLAAP